MKKLLLIVNPISGKMKIKNSLLSVIDTFIKEHYEVIIHITQSKDDALKTIANTSLNDYSLCVVCGGDGTISEVISGLMKHKKNERIPIGYIPTGSTNDFAASHRIPKRIDSAAALAAEGQPTFCDCGRFQDQYFVYVAAFGAFTEVSYNTPQKIKNMLGHSAYFLEIMKCFSNLKPYKLKLTYNADSSTESNIIEGEFIYGMVSNAQSVASLKTGTESISDLNDGVFEILLIKQPSNPMDFQLTLREFLKREFSSDRFICLKSSSIVLECDDEIAWTIDGEFGGDHKRVEIENLHNAFEIIR